MKVKGYALAIVSAVSYGLIPLFILPIKAVNFPLDTTLLYRFFISALFILAYLLYKKETLKVSGKEVRTLAALGVLFSLGSEFLFWGYDLLSPGIASTILFIYPVIVALVMTFFFKEKMAKLTVVSLFITMCGILALCTRETVFDFNFSGLFIASLSAVCYAFYIVIINKANIRASAMKISFYSLLFSSAYYFCKVVMFHEPLAVPNIKMLADISLFGLVTSVTSIVTLVYAIKLIGSTPTSIMGALEPVVAICISVLLFQEKLTLSLVIGVMLILTGVIVNIISDRKSSKAVRKNNKTIGV